MVANSTNNSVIFDSRKARNGGIFFNKGDIYRVNQVQTPETYGYSLKINLIKNLINIYMRSKP